MIRYTSKINVEVYQQIGNDRAICDTARVSTLGGGAETASDDKDSGLIRFLMANKHGSPFEHGSITYRVEAPIFVFWDHVRHRIGVSYNVESSRYRQLQPLFFVADEARVQSGKPGAYTMRAGTEAQTDVMIDANDVAVSAAWSEYVAMLDAGIAREQAMQVLPMSTVISAYVTFNPRSLMNFLELRLGPARKEMQQLAMAYGREFQRYWPVTAGCFESAGRIAP